MAVRLKAFGTPGAQGLTAQDQQVIDFLDKKIPEFAAQAARNAFK